MSDLDFQPVITDTPGYFFWKQSQFAGHLGGDVTQVSHVLLQFVDVVLPVGAVGRLTLLGQIVAMSRSRTVASPKMYRLRTAPLGTLFAGEA